MSDFSTRYSSGSIFDVDLSSGARIGHFDHVEPNHRSFDLAIIEFQDCGACVDQLQISAAEKCINDARATKNGAVVVVFIHGWRHDADWDFVTDDGDDHFKGFRKVLRSLTLRESERYVQEDPRGRRVVGIYLGWNGDSARSWLRWTNWLKYFSFRDRYRTAEKIGEHEDFLKALRAVVNATKTPMDNKPACQLILVGHSMGALMLESGFLSLLADEDHPLIQRGPQERGNCVNTLQNGGPVLFPDVLIALNSAADSEIAKRIKVEIEKQGLTKILVTGKFSYAPPLFMSLTSPADWATRILWRFAQFPSLWRHTDGHDETLITHTLQREQTDITCEPKNKVEDFKQNWHCLRPPKPSNKSTPNISMDLPKGERNGDKPPHDRYTLAPLGDPDRSYTSWIFHVPSEIVTGHNDIFNSRAGSLILALIQVSGAVMSLAEDVETNFEDETLS